MKNPVIFTKIAAAFVLIGTLLTASCHTFDPFPHHRGHGGGWDRGHDGWDRGHGHGGGWDDHGRGRGRR